MGKLIHNIIDTVFLSIIIYIYRIYQLLFLRYSPENTELASRPPQNCVALPEHGKLQSSDGPYRP